MKIIYLAHATIPSRTANSIHVMKMCQAFAKNDHETILITANKTKLSGPESWDVYGFYGVDNCFQLIRMPWLKVKSIRRSFFALLGAMRAKKMKPDLVYTRCIFCCFLALKFGLPVIFETHTPMEKKKKLQKILFRKAIRSTGLKKIVVITHSLRQYFEERYPMLNGFICVAPDGADPVSSDTRPVILPNKGNRLQVGYVGNLYKGKGFEVISQLAAMVQYADFHVVGGNDDLLSLYKKKYSHLDNLIFHGYVPHSETAKYLIAFDIVLLPNQNTMYTRKIEKDIGQWTSPLKLFEYMAAGKAIIASNLPVLREVLENKRNAILCPADDFEAWKKALKNLESVELRCNLGIEAQRDFISKYTWKARAKKVLSDLVEYSAKH